MAGNLSTKPAEAIGWSSEVASWRGCTHRAVPRGRRQRPRGARVRSIIGWCSGSPPTCWATAKRRSIFAGGVPEGLPHAAPFPRAVGAPHLDLPHRRQSGAEPAALVETPASRESGVARRAHSRSRRDRAGRRCVDARSRVHSKGARRAAQDGDSESAVRAADGARAAGDGRFEVRRNRVLARAARGNRQVAAHARASGAARAELGDLRC